MFRKGWGMSFKESVLGIQQSKGMAEILRQKRPLSIITTLIALALAFYHLYTSFAGCPPALLHRSIHLFTVLILIFLTASLKKSSRWYLALNIVLSLLAFAILVFISYDYEDMPWRAEEASPLDLVLGAITLLITIEACRRVVGPAMASLVVFFLLYTRLGGYIPGELGHAGFSWREILDTQFLTLNGVFTTPIGVMSTFIIIFLIFAGLLMKSGAVFAFMDLATKLLGRTSGGPAKAAILASTFMGSVSGSAAANVLVTGSISIPLMKKLGYQPSFAGAVEASVSSGGQFMPPIMGASAFIIAAVLGKPYIIICLRAIIPALLWFFCFFITLHFEAKRLGFKPVPREQIPPTVKVLKDLYFFIPIIALVYLLTQGYSPMYAGFITVVLLFALTFLRKETRFNLTSFIAALEYGIKGALPVAAACAGAGIIVGCVMQSGVGYYLSAALVKISGGQLFLLLPLVVIASLLLGMGMVTVGAYIIVSILVSPAMIDMGVTPIAAHLFPFYFAIISAITPPVAVASYAAAGIADAPPWETGMKGIRLALPALLIPFVFVTQPSLLFLGTPFSILATTITTILGLTCIASALIGYFLKELKIYERITLILASLMLLFPAGAINLIGMGLLALVVLLQKQSPKPGS
ncbi:MAG: TRAP transporter fused permease subunit [Deltaproteobacteria bacterium]|nr:TRAP transporter fused permease subunit [Deltaproteobacteria bacterium]